MKKYIGTKTVMARPMSKLEAYDENLLKAGVIATKKDKNTQGYEVLYEGGYHSWSPKEVFDKAYHLAESPLDRMRIEIDELNDKMLKLSKFIQSERFKGLDEEMQNLLKKQHYHMDKYCEALSSRIILMMGHDTSTKQQ